MIKKDEESFENDWVSLSVCTSCSSNTSRSWGETTKSKFTILSRTQGKDGRARGCHAEETPLIGWQRLHFIKSWLACWLYSHLLNLWVKDLPGAFLKPVHVHCTGNMVRRGKKNKEGEGKGCLGSMENRLRHSAEKWAGDLIWGSSRPAGNI